MLHAGDSCETKNMISREEAKRIAEIPGNLRGSALLTDAENVKRRMGDEGLQQLRQSLAELGYPIEYKDIKAMDWYAIGVRVLTFAVLEDIFGWKDDDFRDMGDNAPKYSFIVKLMMKFFISHEAAFNRAPEYWKKYYSIGTIEVGKLNESTREVNLRIKDFKTIPIYCRYLEGFFRRLMQYLLPEEKVRCEEVKCIFAEDHFHEFKISW